MVAAGLPTIQVLLDDGTGAFPYDITTYVRLVDGIKVSRGREDEQSDVTPGQLTLTLDNSDGRFTLGSTTIGTPSPITVDNRLRVKYTANATAFNRHTGYLSSLPVAWPTGGDQESRVAITVTDAQARAERHVMGVSLAEEIQAVPPNLFWPMNDPATATTATEQSGNRGVALTQAGLGTAVTFGVTTPPGSTDSPAAGFTGGKYLNTPLVGTSPGVVFAFATTGNAVIQGLLELSLGSTAVVITATGQVSIATAVSGAGYNDGLPHAVGVRYTSTTSADFYLDGSLIASGITVDFPGAMRVGGTSVVATLTGTMANLAVWTTAPTGAQMAAITGAYVAELTSARASRIANYAAIPVGTLDTGLTTVPAQDAFGQSAADALRDVNTAEGGTTYVDGSGNLAFHNRNRAVSKTSPDATFAAEFLTEDTAFAIDTQGVINYFSTTSSVTGVTQVVRNTTSELGNGTATHPGHGRYPASQTYLVSTDAEALDRANWIVANHAEPQPRAGTLTLDLLTMTAAQQAAALALEPDSWVRITGLPSQSPTGTTGDFIVQGIAADTLTHNSWTVAFNVVSRSLFNAAIYDDPIYGIYDNSKARYSV